MLSFQFVESKNLQWLIRLLKELRIFFRSGLKNLAFNSFKKNLQWFTRIHNCLIHFYNFNLRFLSCSIHSQNKELGIIFPSELICFKQVFISFPNKTFWKKTCRDQIAAGITIVLFILIQIKIASLCSTQQNAEIFFASILFSFRLRIKSFRKKLQRITLLYNRLVYLHPW